MPVSKELILSGSDSKTIDSEGQKCLLEKTKLTMLWPQRGIIKKLEGRA